MNEETRRLDAALHYLKMGLSIIPVKRTKLPYLESWKIYQERYPTVEEVNEWWRRWPEANIALITGELSGIVALDLDIKHGRSSKDFIIPPTASARSGSGGEHFFFKYPAVGPVMTKAGIQGEGVDIRADGGYILLAPSVNENGSYEWTVPLESKEDIADIPTWLLQLVETKKWSVGKNGVVEGSRNDTAASMAGKILKSMDSELWESLGWEQIIIWNSKNTPPLPEKELRSVWESVKRYHNNLNGDGPGERSAKVDISNLQLWSIGDILSKDFGEEEWLVDFLISKPGMTALSGNPGDFKTWMTMHIAMCVSRSTPVFGEFKANSGGVLIIDEEDHLRLVKKRLELLGAKETDNIHYLSQCGIKVDVEVFRNMLVDIVKEKGIKLVILDSLVRVHQQDENDAKSMAKVFSSLQAIIKEGASVLFTHHHRKQMGFGSSNPGQSMRGSSDILAAVDCHITIEKKKDEEDRLIIRQTKLRQAELRKPFEVKVLMGEFGPSGFEYAGGYDEKKKKAEEASEAVVAVLTDGMKSRVEINDALSEEFGKTAIADGIKLVEEKGEIERVPKEELPKEDRRKAYYRLPEASAILDLEQLPISQAHIVGEKQEDEWGGL